MPAPWRVGGDVRALPLSQMIGDVAEAGDDFVTGLEIPDADVEVALQFCAIGDFQFLGAFELLVRFGGGKGVFDGKAGGAEVMDEPE